MRYRVDVSRQARRDIGDIYAYHREHSPGFADRLLVGLYGAIRTLSEMPHRCPLAPEAQTVGGTVRYLLHRDYRVVYEVIGHRVDVLHVQHSSLPPAG